MQQNADEVEVLFTLMAERYERRSLVITSNLVFGEWDRIFKNPMTTAAAIDRLVHHSVILEFNNKSRRAEVAEERTRKSDDADEVPTKKRKLSRRQLRRQLSPIPANIVDVDHILPEQCHT